jgi:hypothetical protein
MTALTGALAFLRAPGTWLWVVLTLGAGLRVYLLVFTEGTFDVAIKLHHGSAIDAHGLVEYYRRAEVFNHPPVSGRFFQLCAVLAQAAGIPFRLLLRAPFALLDLGSALLLLRVLRDSPYRYVVFAGYWLHPLAILFSSYHGNTDSAVAFFALLALAATIRGRSLSAGAALGVGLWIKLPVLIAAPALLFAFPDWRRRASFAAAAAVIGVSTYLPVLLVEPGLVYARVFAYAGSGMETPRGVPIWGVWNALAPLAADRFVSALASHNALVCWLPILALAWLRRRERSATGIGVTLCASYLILYGFTSYWAYQYLAWSVPFWFFPGARFAVFASVLMGGYIYGVYALFTGSPFLMGKWDFVGHPPWPAWLELLRDASVLFCFLSAWVFLGQAALGERRARRSRTGRSARGCVRSCAPTTAVSRPCPWRRA